MAIKNKILVPGAIGLTAFTGVGSGMIISAISAGAVTTPTTTTSTTSSTTVTAASTMPAHGSASHEDAETTVTGDNATKAQAAAVKYVGSGTAGAVTSDFTKSGYETTVTKSDGSTVEVHLDSSFAVMQGGGPGGN